MRPTNRSFLAVAAALIFFAPVAKADVILYPANDGFELPDEGSGFQYGSQMSPNQLSQAVWTFTPGAGIGANGNGDGFGVTNATNLNHNGSPTTSTMGQAAILQDLGSISQTFGGFTDGFVTVSFSLERRTFFGSDNPIDVQLDGADLGKFQAIDNTVFDTFTVLDPNPLTAGSHTLAFFGTFDPGPGGVNGDNT